MNTWQGIGRLVRNPDIKFIAGTGTAMCNITIAIDRKFKKEGQQEVDFIPIVIFGKRAENTANYMTKGSKVGITGTLQINNYTDKEGNKRNYTSIVADSIEFLDSKGAKDKIENKQKEDNIEIGFEEIDGGDIPF